MVHMDMLKGSEMEEEKEKETGEDQGEREK
jgi:hypothetical protein